METLNPSAYFLRVSDKFFGDFILYDNAVSAGPALLYLLLFRKAYKGGLCRSSQFALARVCKCSVRSIQHYLRPLAVLKYISIEQQEDGRNVYRLLLSQRVRFFIAQEKSDHDQDGGKDQGEEFSSAHAKNLRMGGENSSPIYKSDKSITPPFPPIRRQSARQYPPLASHSQAQRPSQPPKPAGGGILFPGENGNARPPPSKRPMRSLNASMRPTRARKPRNRPAPYGISSGGAARFRALSCCFRPWNASGLPRPGTGNMAALFPIWRTGSVADAGRTKRWQPPLLLRPHRQSFRKNPNRSGAACSAWKISSAQIRP